MTQITSPLSSSSLAISNNNALKYFFFQITKSPISIHRSDNLKINILFILWNSITYGANSIQTQPKQTKTKAEQNKSVFLTDWLLRNLLSGEYINKSNAQATTRRENTQKFHFIIFIYIDCRILVNFQETFSLNDVNDDDEFETAI